MTQDNTGTCPLHNHRTIEQLKRKYSYCPKHSECTHRYLDNLQKLQELDLSRKDCHAKTRKQLTYNCDENTSMLQFHVWTHPQDQASPRN